jgi:hypothetical protein
MSHAYTAGEPMRRRGLPLRAEQLSLLVLMGEFATRHGIGAWARPKDFHAHGNACRTSERLRGLVCRGYAEKQEARPGEWREKPIFHYRITAEGLAELESGK